MSRELMIFSGNANLALAHEICAYLGAKLGEATVSSFSDGEIRIKIEENVRGATSMSCNRLAARQRFPYGIADHDRCAQTLLCLSHYGRDAIFRLCQAGSKGSAPRADYRQAGGRSHQTAGADRVLTMDLHAGQIQGFFNVPVDHLYALPVLLDYITKKKVSDLVIVSPDAGGVERARAFAKRLQANLAIIDKRREGPNQTQIMNIIGDIKGKSTLLLDDMIDTAGTIVQGAQACADKGAREVWTACTHAVLSGPALERLQQSCLTQVIITNTIPIQEKQRLCPKIHQLSVAPLLGEAIRRIHADESVSSLFA